MWKLLFFVVVISPKWNGEKRVGNSSNLNTFFSIPPRYNTFVFQNYILEDNNFFFITYTNFMVWNLQSTTNLHVCQRCMYFLCFSLSCYMYIVYTVCFFSKRMMIPRKSVIIFNLVKIHEDIFWLIGFLDFSETQT